MCFEFASCFGGGRTDDYGGERPNRKEEHGGARRGRDRGRQAAYHHQPPATVDEAGHKAYHDGAGAYAQHKADMETPKLPPWHNKVGDDAYTARLREAAADRRNNAAMDYHHYPTTTTTTLGMY